MKRAPLEMGNMTELRNQHFDNQPAVIVGNGGVFCGTCLEKVSFHRWLASELRLLFAMEMT